MKQYDKDILDRIYKMYNTEKFGYNKICEECKNKINFENGPVPIFHVGNKYKNNDKRIVFVGLVAYGWNDVIINQNETWFEIFNNNQTIIDKTQEDIEYRVRELYFQNYKAVKFLSFIKAACTEIFGSIENGYDNIAITNFVHCNLGDVKDNLRQFVRKNCADFNRAGFVHKEIEILEPTHIVVLTKDYKYTRFTDDFFPKLKYITVKHPSVIGRVKQDFINEIKNFYN